MRYCVLVINELSTTLLSTAPPYQLRAPLHSPLAFIYFFDFISFLFHLLVCICVCVCIHPPTYVFKYVLYIYVCMYSTCVCMFSLFVFVLFALHSFGCCKVETNEQELKTKSLQTFISGAQLLFISNAHPLFLLPPNTLNTPSIRSDPHHPYCHQSDSFQWRCRDKNCLSSV